MGRAPISAVVVQVLLLATLAGSSTLSATELSPEAEPDSVPAEKRREQSAQEEAHRQAIETLESSQGAYATALPEQLFSLGVNLQANGRHLEAVELFRRGVHLARINNGLYSADQIPLLQREIASQIALGQYSEADERQRYLYRVQMRSMESGLSRADAFMQQAQWQYNAYRLAVDGVQYNRLLSMWDLNRLALNDIVDREGQTTSSLLRPLRGMLLAQYLISGYDFQSQSSGFNSSDSIGEQQLANRFHAYRAQSYVKGRAVIKAMYDVQKANRGENSAETVEALTMMGDWTLWHGEKETALLAYQQAVAELVAQGAAEEDISGFFGEPVALPNYDGARPLPEAMSPADGLLQLEFTVGAKGKVSELERLDDNELSSGRVNRIMRTLRKTRFRPVLVMGEPVTTEKVIRAYDIN